MKTVRISLIAVLAVTSLVMVTSQKECAADTATPNVTVAKAGENTKSDIKQDQDKIADERDAIIADGRKLQEAKKAGDKAKIEEIQKDIETRKAAIKSLKDDIYKKSGGGDGAPGRKARRSKGK